MPTPRRYPDHAARQAAYRKRQNDARNTQLRLPAIPTLPGRRRWRAITKRVLALLRTMQTEMQDYCDERSETWQESERGEAMAEQLEALEEAISAVEALDP